MKTCSKIAVAILGIPLVSGCIDDASDPDRGSAITESQISGIAVDGPLAGARVYADLNNNGRRDGFEPSARTDEHGYFSFRPAIGDESARNYCEQGPERHCLRVDNTAGEVQIRVESGFDTVTGEAFRGSISGLVTIAANDDTTIHAITPLTASSSSPATAGDNFWSLNGDEFEPEKAFSAYHKHQALVDLADQMDEEFFLDASHPALVAALYRALSDRITDPEGWQLLDGDEVNGVIHDATLNFTDSVDRFEVENTSLAADFVNQRDAVTGADLELTTLDRDQTKGLVRSLRAFMDLDQTDSEPLTWAFEEIEELNDCNGSTAPERIRISRMVTEMGIANDENRDFCNTIGSGSFPDLSGKDDVSLDRGDGEDLELAFGEDGELSISGGALGEDFEGEKLGGSYSQPTDDQILLDVEAFDGAFSESASLTFVNEPDEPDDKFEFEFNFDGDTDTFETDDDPFN